MLPDRVSNPGPLTYESGALPIALHSPAVFMVNAVQLTGLLSSIRDGSQSSKIFLSIKSFDG